MPDFIPNLPKIVPDAFHGTDAASGRAILAGGFHVSNGEKNYLGEGVYFFEAGRQHAITWATRRCERIGARAYAVLRAEVNLGRCLDFADPIHRKMIAGAARKLRARRRRVTDAAAINFLASQGGIDSIRATRVVGARQSTYGTLFEGSRYLSGYELVICVRTLENITGVWLDHEKATQLREA